MQRLSRDSIISLREELLRTVIPPLLRREGPPHCDEIQLNPSNVNHCLSRIGTSIQ